MTKMMELTKTMETFLGGVTLDAKNVPHFSSAARKAMDEIADFAEETDRDGEQPEEYAPVKDIYRQMMEGIQEAVCEEDRDAICLEKMAELRGAVVEKQKSAARLLKQRSEIHSQGVADGFEAAFMVALLAGYNVHDPYMDEETFKNFFKNWEKEVNRIFKDHCHNEPENLQDVVLLLEGHTNQLRKGMGLEPL